jgi:hypothetical protein
MECEQPSGDDQEEQELAHEQHSSGAWLSASVRNAPTASNTATDVAMRRAIRRSGWNTGSWDTVPFARSTAIVSAIVTANCMGRADPRPRVASRCRGVSERSRSTWALPCLQIFATTPRTRASTPNGISVAPCRRRWGRAAAAPDAEVGLLAEADGSDVIFDSTVRAEFRLAAVKCTPCRSACALVSSTRRLLAVRRPVGASRAGGRSPDRRYLRWSACTPKSAGCW